jgi:hypothetical protein
MMSPVARRGSLDNHCGDADFALRAPSHRARENDERQPTGGDMGKAVEEDREAVVFVSDRIGPALRRRERCLKLAGVIYTVQSEHRPSGIYYKLAVRAGDAVTAHLALQMGGCARSSRLRETRTSIAASLREVARTLWDETLLLFGRVADLIRASTPRLLR